MTSSSTGSARTVIATYLATTVLFTLSTSIIWGVNTLFLLAAGLSLFQVFVANAAYSAGDLLFQVPTGVLADTVGRKTSFLLALATLALSTLGYLAASYYRMGLGAFVVASVFIGLGFTFYTGALEAWLVDALNTCGYEGSREQVFSWGGIAFSGATLVGTLAGGFLGQVDLSLPYVARVVALVLTFVLAAIFMREERAARPRLERGAFRRRAGEVAVAAVRYGRRDDVIRPLLLASGVFGVFFVFGVYSTQRFFLDVLGREAVWVNGVIAAAFSLSNMIGAALVTRVTRQGTRPAAPILARIFVGFAVCVLSIGVIGLLTPRSARGVIPLLAVVLVYLAFGMLFGLFRPIRQAFMNPYIRSEERATVLSLDSLMLDGGAVVGQPGLGLLSQAVSIPFAWVVSGVFLFAGAPLYSSAAKAVEERGPTPLAEPGIPIDPVG